MKINDLFLVRRKQQKSSYIEGKVSGTAHHQTKKPKTGFRSVFFLSDDGVCPKLYLQYISILLISFNEENVIYFHLSTNIFIMFLARALHNISRM